MYLKDYLGFLSEMSVDKDWFNLNPSHKLSLLPSNSGIDLNLLTLSDGMIFYDGDDIGSINVGRDVELEFNKKLSIELISHILIKLIDYIGLTRFNVGLGINKIYLYRVLEYLHGLGIKGYSLGADLVYDTNSNRLKDGLELLIRRMSSSLELDDVEVRSDFGIDYRISVPKLKAILAYYDLRYSVNDNALNRFIKGDYLITVNEGELFVGYLPSLLNSTGLGYLIYKKVLTANKFGRTGSTKSAALQVWKKLLQDKDFYHLVLDLENVAVIYKHQDESSIVRQFKGLTDNGRLKPLEIDKELLKLDGIKKLKNYE